MPMRRTPTLTTSPMETSRMNEFLQGELGPDGKRYHRVPRAHEFIPDPSEFEEPKGDRN